jgi:hypothetical protein
MRLKRLSLAEWDDALPDHGIEPLYAPEALEVLDDHTASDLQLFAGFNGDRPVALLPVFGRSTPLGRVLTSPPPGVGVSRLGPVLMPASPKRSKREKLNREFTDLVVDATRADSRATLLRMVCPTAYGDPRPYVWDDLDIETQWTYRLSVDDRTPDELLAEASLCVTDSATMAMEAAVLGTPTVRSNSIDAGGEFGTLSAVASYGLIEQVPATGVVAAAR